MHCLIRCTLLITTIKLSYQLGCPYSEDQMLMSATNAISRDALTVELNQYNPKPVPESTLLLAKNYLNHNNAIQGPYPGDALGQTSLSSLFGSIDGTMKLDCAVPPVSCAKDPSNNYYRTYDGSCNNFGHPGYGMANTRYGRLLPPKYGDGKYAPTRSLAGSALPNPRLLSLSLYGDETVSDSFRSLMSMQWGQYVAHDISQFMVDSSLEDCCENANNRLCYSIPLHPFGPITLASGKTCLSFSRSLSDADMACTQGNLGYAEKISKSTPYLDLSSIYGNSLEQNIRVRQYQGGLLKTVRYNHQQFLPTIPNVHGECQAKADQCYDIPDKRNQFQPTIAVIQTILVREHNRLAAILAKLNSHYSDEKVFQVARKINIAQYQKIAYYDWLPLLLGPMYSYDNRLIYNVGPSDYVNDYDESLDPAPYAENAAAAFRYGHTQIPGWFSLVSPNRNHNQTLRLSDYFKRQETMQLLQSGNNFDALVRGMVTQLQKRSDANLDKEIQHQFDRNVFDEYGSDLKSTDIQRGRDFGVASYNDFRQYCGLPRAYDWSGFSDEISMEKIALLQKFYASPNDVDLGVGGSLEKHSDEAIFGPTFQCIMSKQFLKTRKSDRFFFEHEDLSAGFTKEQLEEIRKVSLAGILCANTVNLKYVQPNVFAFPNYDNGLVSCNSIPQLNLRLWQEQTEY